jgi:hypothetical protein
MLLVKITIKMSLNFIIFYQILLFFSYKILKFQVGKCRDFFSKFPTSRHGEKSSSRLGNSRLKIPTVKL